MLRTSPDDQAEASSQLAEGELFNVLDVSGGWAWGYCVHDDYVGYLPAAHLGDATTASHRVSALAAPVFTGPSIKTAVARTLSLGARIAGRIEGDFLNIGRGYIHIRHVSPIEARETDPVAVAERMLGQPYLWGGRGADGVDCSGLVQRALEFSGIACPRDSDQQRETVGIPIADDIPLQRGDLVCFPGHVGLMVDPERMIHANAFWMAVTIEPLADVVARLSETHAQPILARRRLS